MVDADERTKIYTQKANISEKYPKVFTSFGKVKLLPVHIHLREKQIKLVAQKLPTVALNLMEPLRSARNPG